MKTISLTKKINAIVSENIQEEVKEKEIKLKCCNECRYYSKVWVGGKYLHCCTNDNDNPKTLRDVKALFEKCPINGQIIVKETHIKKYGIITKEEDDDCEGYISIVDFSPTYWEEDGYNPNICWNNIVVFYYNNEEEKSKMMEMTLDYYYRFGFDESVFIKTCLG